jgi:hypothetical protein
MDEQMWIERAGGAAGGGGVGDATEAKQDIIIADVTAINGDAMRGTNAAALAATALSDAVWTAAMAAFLNSPIGDIPTTAMRGTENAALAATALTDAIWTNAKAAFLDASVAAIPTTAQRGTDNAALAATALTDATWTNAKAAFLNAAIGDIPTTAQRGTDNAALAATALSDVTWTDAKAAFLTKEITVGIKKGVERTIMYKMVDATDFATPETGAAVTETISKDGGAFNACTNNDVEVSNGWYKITLTAAEMNADEIVFMGTAAGCAQCDRIIVTES